MVLYDALEVDIYKGPDETSPVWHTLVPQCESINNNLL